MFEARIIVYDADRHQLTEGIVRRETPDAAMQAVQEWVHENLLNMAAAGDPAVLDWHEFEVTVRRGA